MKDLIVNSLDSLLKTNDELLRIDSEIESFLKGLEKKIIELDPKHEFTVNIRGTPLKIEEGISQFTWDENRYPKNQKTIEEIMSKIMEKYNATKNNFKAKSDEYQQEQEKLKLKLKSDNEAANLMKVDYREIIKKTTREHFIQTDYLTTMLCFVPTNLQEAFLKNYHDLADNMVLPHSALQLDKGEDEKMSLFRVVIMSHQKEGFMSDCRNKYRVVAKEFDENEILRLPEEFKEKEMLKITIQDKKKNLYLNSTAGFSEVYYALLHLKVN